jgi:nucleotide-binding universal stress UspA family protein
MLKCPVCGTHVPKEVALELPAEKGSEFYCSLACAIMSEKEREQAGAAVSSSHALPHAPREIVVAVDGSGPALRAVELAASLAKLTDGRLTLIHAIDPALIRLLPLDSALADAARLGLDIGQLEETLRKDAVRQIDRDGRVCESAGVRFTSRVALDQPVRAIAEAAEKADLVVMGSRGLGAFSGAALGSLSHRVIGETHKPVLIVH